MSLPEINYIAQLNAVWNVFRADTELRQSEKIIYLTLLQLCNEKHWQNPFKTTYSNVMETSGVSSKGTYYKSLEILVQKGLIEYKKAKNQNQFAEFFIVPLNNPQYQKMILQRERNNTCDEPATSTAEGIFIKQETVKLKNKNIITDTAEADQGKNKSKYNLDFIDPLFLPAYQRWLDYRKSIRKNFKTQDTLEANYKRLIELSNNDPTLATLIIDQSISNEYTGLFPVRSKNNYGSKYKLSGNEYKIPNDDEYYAGL